MTWLLSSHGAMCVLRGFSVQYHQHYQHQLVVQYRSSGIEYDTMSTLVSY